MSAPSGIDAFGHDVHRLRFAVEDPTGLAKVLRPIAKQYGDALQDTEVEEILGICDKGIHVSSLWGVVRGLDAFAVIIQQEKEALQIMWNTKFKPVTANLFVRHGSVILISKNRKDNVMRKLIARPSIQDIKEHVVINPETRLITFRSLTLDWEVMQF